MAIKRIKDLSPTSKGFIVLIILLIIGIILRWSAIKEEAKRSFGFFRSDSDTTVHIE